MSNNQGSGPVLADSETRDFWNAPRLFADSSRRNMLMRESSELPIRHNFQSTKRQNCGNIPRHLNPFFANSSHGGSGSSVVNIEHEGNINQQVSTSSGFHGARNHLGRMPNVRHFPSGCLESGNTNEGLLRETYWNAVLRGSEERTPHHPVGSNFMVGNDNPHLGRMPCKRKSTMLDGSTSSLDLRSSGLWDNDVTRFTETSGISRGSTASVMLSDSTPVIPESLNSRNNDGHYQSDGMNLLHFQQSNRDYDRTIFATREIHQASMPSNRVTSASYPSQTWMARRISPNENMLEANGYHNVCPVDSALSQNIGSAADTVWGGISTYIGQGNNNLGYNVIPRDINSGSGMGNHVRHYLGGSSNWHGISPAECILQNTVEEPNRTTLNLSRTLPIREAGVNLPHLPSNPFMYLGSGPPQSSSYTLGGLSNRRSNGGLLLSPSASCVTSNHTIQRSQATYPNNSIQRSQATYGDAYPSFPSAQGTVVACTFPGSADGGRASLPNLYRMPLRGLPVIPAERINRQHRFSHDLLDHDQHSNMRLDVDNMSYEDLLALEERIGNVNTGLSEDIIQKCLKVAHYSSSDAASAIISQENEVKCCICQEEYSDDDKIGKLDCGHGYHTDCIKQWLMLKNLCPICKCSAYPAS